MQGFSFRRLGSIITWLWSLLGYKDKEMEILFLKYFHENFGESLGKVKMQILSTNEWRFNVTSNLMNFCSENQTIKLYFALKSLKKTKMTTTDQFNLLPSGQISWDICARSTRYSELSGVE